MIDVFDFIMDEENGWNEISQVENIEKDSTFKEFDLVF